mgnify:CR=1 FL=1
MTAWPPKNVQLTPGKRVLFLTKDFDLLRKQLYEGLDLQMKDLRVEDLLDEARGAGRAERCLRAGVGKSRVRLNHNLRCRVVGFAAQLVERAPVRLVHSAHHRVCRDAGRASAGPRHVLPLGVLPDLL